MVDMLDLFLFTILVITLLLGFRWIMVLLVKTIISLASSLVGLVGTIVIVSGLVWLFSEIVK